MYKERKEIYESLIKSSDFGSFLTVSSENPTVEAVSEKQAKSKEQILKDLPRTFANFDVFNYASKLQQLYRILYSYTLYDPQLGYTQGMNLLVGGLLLHTEESVAFWLFVTLIEDYDMRDVFTDSMGGIQRLCGVLQKLINHYLPKLAKHFKQNDIRIEMFASTWILSLF